MKIIKSTSVVLESGMLLSREILEQMTFQSNLFKLQYDNYPDGIIYGFEYFEENGVPYFSSGLIKYNEKYFFSVEKTNINEIFDEFDNDEVIDNTIYSALAFFPCDNERANEGIISDCLQLKLCNINDSNLQSGCAILLTEFQYHFKKRTLMPEINAKEALNNQLNSNGYYYTFLNVKYSLPYETTFSPYIFGLIKKCLAEKKCKTDADMALLFMLGQNRVLSLNVLKEWFNYNGVSVDLNNRQNIIMKFLDTIKIEKKEEVIVKKEPEINPSVQKGGFGI